MCRDLGEWCGRGLDTSQGGVLLGTSPVESLGRGVHVDGISAGRVAGRGAASVSRPVSLVVPRVVVVGWGLVFPGLLGCDSCRDWPVCWCLAMDLSTLEGEGVSSLGPSRSVVA